MITGIPVSITKPVIFPSSCISCQNDYTARRLPFIDHLNIPLYTSFYHVIITLLCLIFKHPEKEDGSENFVG
ncbi:hypothetical protein ECZU50_29250 [Escherichia coli]|nr:hypothetical protein ECZU50_29250 [Escherichia coli]